MSGSQYMLAAAGVIEHVYKVMFCACVCMILLEFNNIII